MLPETAMTDHDKSREPLLDEVVSLRHRLAETIAERDRLRDELHEPEQKWRQLAETCPDSILSVSRDGTILFINHTHPGYPPVDQLIGQKVYDWIPPEQAAPMRQGIEHVFTTGGGTSFEVASVDQDGRVSWWATRLGPVKLQGEVRAATIIAADITPRKLAEERLRRLAVELARSNAELEQFAYIASHDLQEPLRKVQAFGDLLVSTYQDQLGDEGRDFICRMQNATRRMQTLINDLLTYARVTTRARPFERVDLGEVAAQVVADLETRLRDTHGRVELGPLLVLDADPLQMRQLFQNLIGNALKFHRPDVPPVVQVSGQVLSEEAKAGSGLPRKRYEILFEDNGIGFAEKYLDRIFAPFQRLHARSEYEGTGMGLAICRKIVERHSGSITARSTPGQGSTFVVSLPLWQPKGEPDYE
jgi:PAS domain S-box-containing protein